MVRNGKIWLVALPLLLVSAGGSSAFQLFGGSGGAPTRQGASTATDKAQIDSSSSSSSSLPNPGSEIWIPGIGVVGRMPSLDFGLEMLYGEGGQAEAAPDRSDFETLDPDFAIKGTLRKKF